MILADVRTHSRTLPNANTRGHAHTNAGWADGPSLSCWHKRMEFRQHSTRRCTNRAPCIHGRGRLVSFTLCCASRITPTKTGACMCERERVSSFCLLVSEVGHDIFHVTQCFKDRFGRVVCVRVWGVVVVACSIGAGGWSASLAKSLVGKFLLEGCEPSRLASVSAG